METTLVSTDLLEQSIEEALTRTLGSCFSNIPSGLVERLVDHYNRHGAEGLLDHLIQSQHYQLEEYASAESFTRQFLHLAESRIDIKEYRVSLEYWRSEQTLVVRTHRRPRPTSAQGLVETYRHAQEQGDYFPERLRRALDEVATLL